MLTIDEIKNISFRKATLNGGYRAEDVDSFIDEVIVSFEQLKKEKTNLVHKIDVLATRVEQYRADEETVRNALLASQKVADACIREAKEKAAKIVRDAESFGHDMGITLDLACGTGTLTRLLKKRGVDVFGIDYSMEMLSEAMQSASEEGLDILFLRQKMQSIDLYGTINTCVCTLDSINHLTKIEDVAKTFDRVGLFMDDDGLFIFDVNTVYKHKNVLADNTFVYENDSVFCVWQNTPEDDNKVKIDLDFFEEENGVYYRSSESFSERAYTDDEIRKMLTDAGFEVEAVYGDLTLESPKADEQRVIYVARMKKSRNKEFNESKG